MNSATIDHLHRRQDGICPECRLPILPGEATDVDHRLSKARGGGDELDNLQLTHARCNRIKGKGRKDGASGPAQKRYTPSTVDAIAQRVAEDEGVPQSLVTRRIASWASSIGFRSRPSGGSTGGIYFEYVGSETNVPVISIWGKGTVQLHFDKMGQIPRLADPAAKLEFIERLVRSVPRLSALRGFSSLTNAMSKGPEVYVWTFLDETRESIDEDALARFFGTYESVLK